jgi:hypothetical protein
MFFLAARTLAKSHEIAVHGGPRYASQLRRPFVSLALAQQPHDFHPLLHSRMWMLISLLVKLLALLFGKLQSLLSGHPWLLSGFVWVIAPWIDVDPNRDRIRLSTRLHRTMAGNGRIAEIPPKNHASTGGLFSVRRGTVGGTAAADRGGPVNADGPRATRTREEATGIRIASRRVQNSKPVNRNWFRATRVSLPGDRWKARHRPKQKPPPSQQNDPSKATLSISDRMQPGTGDASAGQ